MAERENENTKNNEDQIMAGIQNATSGTTNNGGPSPHFNPIRSGVAPQPQFQFPQFPQFPSNPFSSNSGFNNQGFPTQNQGFHPSGLAFGSIQPPASSNPAFAAGYNLAPMTGSATSSFSQMSPFGQGPNPTMQPLHPGGSTASRWVFNPNLSTMLHTRNTCSTCEATRAHVVSAFADNNVSFTAANQERVDHIRQTALGGNSNGEDRDAYDRIRDNFDEAKHDLERIRKERDKEISQLQSRNQELASQVPKANSPAHLGKRKRTEARPTTSTAVTSSQHEDTEMANLSDDESVNIIVGTVSQPTPRFTPIVCNPVTPEDLPDGGYRTKEDFILYGNDAADARHNEQLGVPISHGGGIDHIKKAANITTVLEYIGLMRTLQNINDSGNNFEWRHWFTFTAARDRHRQAVNTAVDQRNDLDHTAIANFFKPRFVGYTYDQNAAKKDKGKGRAPPKTEFEDPSSYTIGSLPTASMGGQSSWKVEPSMDNTQGESSSTTTRSGMRPPTHNDTPEYWAQYHFFYPTKNGGIQRDANNHVSL
ncbi:hypothetical protein BT96DRAFT_987075 [Gymnopus androsaceus JB14]|uniref:Uncharacterized protein n=1 Tax=Gymnopus androsaceus JB14 TaxID=1447944 RepID=A0A6A4I875_9AGAR|nr:hypothetical protein BT96DRAFT_987075 [Gymnopus androsaceus JB14]